MRNGITFYILLILLFCAGIGTAQSPVGYQPEEEAEQKKASEDEEVPEGEKWDVANPPGPYYEIEIDTDEGTWMSVDVSPDGATVVYRLGSPAQLYSIPLEGGEPTFLSESPEGGSLGMVPAESHRFSGPRR